MTVDIVVVNYRTPDDLRSFIESYRETATDECQLTIMDVDPVTPFNFREMPSGTIITMAKNDGYSAAVNYGVSTGDGDIIGIFNADIILKPGTIEKCVSALRENDDWANLGPMQIDSQGRVTHGGILGTQEAPFQRGWHQVAHDSWREVRDDAVMVMGSAYFTKRKVWEELTNCETYQSCFPGVSGAFLPTFLYYEETGHSYHSTAHGYKNVYYGLAECVHEWHGSIHKYGDQGAFGESQHMFRTFCDAHGIPHD